MSKMASIRALKEKLGLELSAHLRMQAKLMTQLHDNVLPVVAGADGSTSAGGASSDGGGGDGGDDDYYYSYSYSHSCSYSYYY